MLTDDSNKFIWHQALPATVQAVFTQNGFLSHGHTAGQDEPVGIIVDKTSYYAESGGQVTSKASKSSTFVPVKQVNWGVHRRQNLIVYADGWAGWRVWLRLADGC
jgi:alanyl-tRNA synthetase